MKTLVAFIVLAALLAIAIEVSKKTKNTNEHPKKRRLLTQREEAMFNRLTSALPELHVLAQVSFGALLQARSRSTRNTFDRKIADYVICNASLQPIAVIELDDASHRTKEDSDAQRDQLLIQAGYRVIRYNNIPDITQVQRDIDPQPSTTKKGEQHAINDEPT
ncbi:MAG: DUF2726 domain-containing protein [Burkholderiales bacterium]|nr:DUF2726 domain-containing protein [Burkholderiales bacterium]